MNRHGDPQVIYDTNIRLVKQLIKALESSEGPKHVLFSSSTQEEADNPYGNSKREGRKLLEDWAQRTGSSFTGMIIPNVFGPFGNPYYNSVVATFSHQLTHGEKPQIQVDGQLKLIYVGELVEHIYQLITITNHQSPIPSHQSPIPSHQSPITNHQSPVTNHQSPVTNHQSPITSHQSPITSHQSPITSHQSPESPSPTLPKRKFPKSCHSSKIIKSYTSIRAFFLRWTIRSNAICSTRLSAISITNIFSR